MFNAIDYEAQQRVIAYCKRRAPTYSDDDVIAALEAIYDAMQGAEVMASRMENAHFETFIAQLVELGIDPFLMQEEPYLEEVRLTYQLQFLETMETLFARTESYLHTHDGKMFYGGGHDVWQKIDSAAGWKAITDDVPLVPQITERIAADTARLETRMHQRLDKNRQRHIGIPAFIWRTRDDSRVRDAHAAYDDRIYPWDGAPEGGPGMGSFGCRCIAEPYYSDDMTLSPHEVEVAGLGVIRTIITAIAATTKKTGEKLKEAKNGSIMRQTDKRLDNILRPNGRMIGKRGKGKNVRIVSGGDKAAQSLFKKLSKGGKSSVPKTYKGKASELPNGTWIGYRTTSKSGGSAVDIKFANGTRIKIHFVK